MTRPLRTSASTELAGFGVRFASLVVDAVLLGRIWTVFDERRQGWHDEFAGTIVVRTARPSEG